MTTPEEKNRLAALAPLADKIEAQLKTLGPPHDDCVVLLKEGFHFGRQDSPS